MALVVVFSLATVFSQDYYFSLWGSPVRSGGLVNVAFYIALSAFSFFILKENEWKKVWDCAIVVGVLVSLVAIFQFYGILSTIFTSVPDRPSSTLGNPIFLAIYILLLFFLALSFTIKEDKKIKKVFYLSALLIFFFTILITGVRASWLGLAIGGFYFLIFYPKKITKIKLSALVVLVLIVVTVVYVNTNSWLPKNKILQSVASRLSFESLKKEGRFEAWPVMVKVILAKPFVGWGPENQQIGFDKHYNPQTVIFPWWDRAHNIFLDIASQAGIGALLIYISLFVCTFYQLHKIKFTNGNNDHLIAHTIQATLIAYLVANLFSFDSFSSYVIFFLLIGYSAHIIYKHKEQTHITAHKWLIVPSIALFLIGIVFLWQYNALPISVNAQVNKAENLATAQKCDQSLSVMDNVLKKHTILDSYVRMKYVEFLRTCDGFYPDKDVDYSKRGAEILKEAVKIQPIYSRLWIYLGSFTTAMASNEKDKTMQSHLIEESYSYLHKAQQLAPLHAEVLIERIKADLVVKDYTSMENDAQACQNMDPKNSQCYFAKALAELYGGEYQKAHDDVSVGLSYVDLDLLRGFDYSDVSDLWAVPPIIDIWAQNNQYQNIADVYESLLANKINPPWHASLAVAYQKLGRYKEAREQALIFLKLTPRSKDEVDNFLKTLPQ